MLFAIKKKLFFWIEKIHWKIFNQPMSREMEKFIKNFSVVFIGMLFSSLVLFLLNLGGAIILGPLEYGKFQTIFATSQFIIILMLLGLNTASAKYISESQNPKEKNIIKNTSLILLTLSTLFFGGIFFIFNDILSKVLNIELKLFNLAIVLGIAISFYYFFRSIWQGFQKMKFLSFLEIIYSVTAILFFLFFIYFKNTEYKSIYWALVIGYSFFILVSLLKFKNFLKEKIFDFNISKKIFNYGIYAILGSISGFLLGSTDKLILNKFLGQETVGIYAAYLLASTIIFTQLINIFITAFFPHASSIKDKTEIAKKLNKLSKLIFFFSLVLSLAIIVIILKLIGSAYPLKITYIFLFALNAGFLSIYQIKMWLLNSEGITGVKTTIQGSLAAGTINLLLGFLMIPLYGIYGAITASIISNAILYFYLSNKINNFFIYEKN